MSNCIVGSDNYYSCIMQNCSGRIGSGQTLFNYWDNNDCPGAYNAVLNSSVTLGKNRRLMYDMINLNSVQSSVNQLFNTYLQTNTITDSVTSGFNTFQNTLLDLCINPALPGVCTTFLNGYCSQFTRQQVINSPILTNFCGCYVAPDPIYLQYTLGTPPCRTGNPGCAGCTAGTTGCTGQPACDPICHRALTSQKANPITGTLIKCPQSICVIDNVVVNINSTTVPGGINFNNVCSGCGGGDGNSGCLCIMSGINVSTTASNIGLGTNFNQFCQGNSVCLVQNETGQVISAGQCNNINPANTHISPFTVSPISGVIFIMILITVIIFIIAIIARNSYHIVAVPN